MPKVLFAGGRLESLIVYSGSPADNTGGSFDATYCDASLSLNNGSCGHLLTDSNNATTTVVAGQTFYWHADGYFTGGSSTADYVVLYDSSGFPWVKFQLAGGGGPDIQLKVNTGTGAAPVWTQLTQYQFANNARQTMDLAISIGAGGTHTAQVFSGGNSVYSGTWTQAAFTNIANVRYGGPNQLSQILCTEGYSTIGAKVKTIRATGAGQYSQWSGAYTDVNEAADNDTTNNTALAAGLKQSYPMGAVTIPTGYVCRGVHQWLRGKNDGTAPTTITGFVRRAGSDYNSPQPVTLGVGYGPAGSRWDLDPSTGLAWTQSGLNEPIQLGFTSAT